MNEVCNGEQKGHKYLYFKIFYGGQKLHKYLSSLRVRGTSLLTCSYIGELRNGRKSKCENEPFSSIVLTLILRRVLSSIFFLIQLEFTAVGMNLTKHEIKTPCWMVVEFLKQYKVRFCSTLSIFRIQSSYMEGIVYIDAT